ncbi:MAG: hypothetical protein IPK07_26855 [Deltaproteobacteria bacterium]|nr:hypothetical protein [Deltaproteobacteria bacterium]
MARRPVLSITGLLVASGCVGSTMQPSAVIDHPPTPAAHASPRAGSEDRTPAQPGDAPPGALREDLAEDREDPGWYRHPPETVAASVDADELRRNGVHP